MFLVFSVVFLLVSQVSQSPCHTQLSAIKPSIIALHSHASSHLPINQTFIVTDNGNNSSSENIIPICCASGYIVNSSACRQDFKHAVNDVTFPSIYNQELKLTNKTPDDFRRRYGIPCHHGLYALNADEPDFDVFYLLENGTIYQNNTLLDCPDNWLNLDNYCLANVVIDDEAYSVVAVCLPQMELDIPITYPIGIVLSVPFLAITFLVYALIPELKNIHGLTLMSYVASLFLAYIALAIVQFGGHEIIAAQKLCTSLAFIIHFSFLASFFWLNVMCFDIWWTFGGFRSLQGSIKQRERKKFTIYSIYAWGCAALLTMICLIMDLHPDIPRHFIRPQFGEEACWFMTEKAKAIYFYGPMGVTVICNIILFISTAIKIIHHKKETANQLKSVDSRRHDDNKQWFNLYLKLFIVMGINWSMEIISWLCKGKAPDYVWYVTDLANTLQGVIIFIIFVWKQKIKRLLLKRLGWKTTRFRSNTSTRSGYASSTSTRTVTSTMTPLQSKVNSTEMNRFSTPIEENDCV